MKDKMRIIIFTVKYFDDELILCPRNEIHEHDTKTTRKTNEMLSS